MTDVGLAKVKVFISWSGQASHRVAQALSEWLPDLMDHLEFWFSSEDLRPGQRWSAEIASALNACDIGVLVVTPENMLSPWLTFEAGALSKSHATSHVTPFLIGVEPSTLSGPLAQFQGVSADRAGTLKLVMSLAQLGHSQSVAAPVSRRFERFWPDFEKVLVEIASNPAPKPTDQTAIEQLREQVTDLGHLVRQLVATSAMSVISQAEINPVPVGKPSDLADLARFEGAWRGKNGTHLYMRIVNGRLLAPYCYMGNNELTSVYSEWKRVSDYWFTRFRWIHDGVSGFGFYRLENVDRISGQWWMDGDITEEIVSEPPSKAGTRAVWTRLLNASTPKWAEDYFRQQANGG